MKRKISELAIASLVMVLLGIASVIIGRYMNSDLIRGMGAFFFGSGAFYLIYTIAKGWFFD